MVKFGFNNEAISDTRVTRALDMTALRANAFGLISNARADVMLVILPGEEMQERIKGIASRAYSNFLAFRHVKYFLSYKGVENAIRRVQQGEGIYSIYLVSTARFNSSFKWRRIQAPPFSRVLGGVRRDYAWSMELDLVFLTPFVFPLVNEEHGLAMIGRDTNNNDVYWVFGKLSPHMLIVGPTGTGKTTLAMSMAYQVKRELGGTVRVLIIDPHGHTKHLGKLMRVNVVDLAGTKVITSDLSTLVESIRMSNPLLSVGTEGALLRMAGMGNGEVLGIDDLVGRIRKLANDLILKEAYYNLYNSLALLLNYYDHGEVKPLDVNQLLNDDVIFMMGSIINDELLRYLTMLILLSVMRRAVMECRNPPCPLKYLVIIDEAHNVLGLPSEYKLLGVSNPVEKMLRELRKFGVALWVLMQPPVDVLDPSVLENMGTLVMLSGNSQYVSHLLPVISGISNDDALWLLSGRYKALVMRQGEPKPTRLVQLFVPRELIMEKNNYDFESTDNR
ncbi:DUF87 domain-containing protein [Vulcanisaeta souniana]|uniref:ATP-binding protein n=1 Tax=Vulcanisaeta souniana TaxID=164452 RepID=UPI000B2489EA|nr:DUF87 domain-containing protein [Vulcanisaeta souniana]